MDSMTFKTNGRWVQLHRQQGAWCLNGAYMAPTAASAQQQAKEVCRASQEPHKST